VRELRLSHALPTSRAARRGAIALWLLSPAFLAAQPGDSVRVVAPAKPASWHVLSTVYYSSADNGFGIWRGQDVRVLYSGTRVSPFLNLGSQSRPNGHQEAVGAGSYIVFTPWMFSIVGIGVAPDRGTVLFPKLRTDASLFVAVPGLKGVLMSAGMTDLRFTDARAGGRIFSLGPTIYHGRGIYSGAAYLNQDRASGARSHSWQAGGQWGAQGQYWIGGGIGSGNEAYRLLAATPFDARFRSQFASAFVSKWISKGTGVSVRLDVERKIDVFNRRAIGLTYFVDF
jgi:YaiO family outer membrane protein